MSELIRMNNVSKIYNKGKSNEVEIGRAHV